MVYADTLQNSKLREILTVNGATLVGNPDELGQYANDPNYRIAFVLPSRWTAQQNPIPDVPPGTDFVTEMWVERCIIYKTLLEPSNDILSRSFHTLSQNCKLILPQSPRMDTNAYYLQVSRGSMWPRPVSSTKSKSLPR